MRLASLRDPADTHAAWIAHWFPGYRREDMALLTLQQIVDMHAFATATGDD